MRDPDQRFAKCFMPVLTIFLVAAVGPVAFADSEEPAAKKTPSLTGQQVYNNVCVACHSPPGIGGAPALGDASAWTPRIAKGMDTLADHALNGFTGTTGVMPKKGERVDLSDEEVVGAVKYMVEQVAR
jgi:S-disulfanyl-L-cysteine oxidoreductase SoxD